MTETLSVIDVSGVQRYIFGSNKLQEQIGASALVRHLTEELIRQKVEDHGATVIVSGGGNVLYQSESADIARRIARTASELALAHTPGLDLYAAHVAITGAIGGEEGSYNQLFKHLGLAKQRRVPTEASFSLGVTAECAATGAPAVAIDDQRSISAELMAKQQGLPIAEAQLEKLIEAIPDHDSFKFTNDFDELGRTRGEQSQVAVVHADGNGFGQRFRTLVDCYPDKADNQTCLQALTNLSERIEIAGKTALQRTIAWLISVVSRAAREPCDETNAFSRLAHQITNDGIATLPFRPLLFGGDDVTFVCDGRLGLPLAARYLWEFEQAACDLPFGGAGYAAAGVAIVRSHYPFARAYAVCEQLCASAKHDLRTYKLTASALDWHVAQTGLAGSLAEIRAREYKVEAGSLLQRPLTLHTDAGFSPAWRTWPAFVAIVTAFNEHAAPGEPSKWGDRRNKLIPLRDTLRAGPKDAKSYRDTYNLPELPTFREVVTAGAAQIEGWHDGRSVYFDAIEAIDLLLIDPLLSEQEAHA
jgi:hypothetical protein